MILLRPCKKNLFLACALILCPTFIESVPYFFLNKMKEHWKSLCYLTANISLNFLALVFYRSDWDHQVWCIWQDGDVWTSMVPCRCWEGQDKRLSCTCLMYLAASIMRLSLLNLCLLLWNLEDFCLFFLASVYSVIIGPTSWRCQVPLCRICEDFFLAAWFYSLESIAGFGVSCLGGGWWRNFNSKEDCSWVKVGKSWKLQGQD